MRNIFLILLVFQSLSYSQDISLDDLLNIRSIPELKLFAFDNSFVIDKKSESKRSFYYKLNYININNEEYADYQIALYLILKWKEDYDGVESDKRLGFVMNLNHWAEYEEYADENKILNEKFLKSIKNKCVIEQINFWMNEQGHKYDKNKTDAEEYSTGEIADVIYSCENRFGQKVTIDREIHRDSKYGGVKFTFWNEEATGLQRDDSFTLD